MIHLETWHARRAWGATVPVEEATSKWNVKRGLIGLWAVSAVIWVGVVGAEGLVGWNNNPWRADAEKDRKGCAAHPTESYYCSPLIDEKSGRPLRDLSAEFDKSLISEHLAWAFGGPTVAVGFGAMVWWVAMGFKRN
jgi:hypothetical protein